MTPKQLAERVVYLLSMVYVNNLKLFNFKEYELLAMKIWRDIMQASDQDTDYEFIGIVEDLHEGLEHIVHDNKEAEQLIRDIADQLSEIDNIIAYKLQEHTA
jgi:hypothetical protein